MGVHICRDRGIYGALDRSTLADFASQDCPEARIDAERKRDLRFAVVGAGLLQRTGRDGVITIRAAYISVDCATSDVIAVRRVLNRPLSAKYIILNGSGRDNFGRRVQLIA